MSYCVLMAGQDLKHGWENFWTFFNSNHDAMLALGVVISAFTALTASRMQSTISRAQRLTDNRVRWIEELRKEVVEFVAITSDAVDMEFILHESKVDFLSSKDGEAYREAIRKMERMRNSISLRLNLKKSSHKELLQAVELVRAQTYNLGKHFESKEKFEGEVKKFSEARGAIVDLAAKVMKTEWEKAKQGK